MKRFHLKPGMSLFACAACALGLLLWARLLLVSHPPRVATADPVLVLPRPVQQPLPAPTTPKAESKDDTELDEPPRPAAIRN